MQSIYSYIVSPIKNRYNNKKNIGKNEIILNTSIEDHKFVNRNAIIIKLPKIKANDYLKINDEVIVHHNVFRRFYDIRGKEKNSKSYFEENKYFCFEDQIFLYKRNNKWFTPPGFCFVKPIHKLNKLNLDKHEPLMGVLKHSGSDLKAFNLSNNDLIGFTPNSEYEFVIDNELLYRVPINSISIKYERKKTKIEYNPSWL